MLLLNSRHEDYSCEAQFPVLILYTASPGEKPVRLWLVMVAHRCEEEKLCNSIRVHALRVRSHEIATQMMVLTFRSSVQMKIPGSGTDLIVPEFTSSHLFEHALQLLLTHLRSSSGNSC